MRKTTIITILLTFAITALLGQSTINNSLLGSWKLTGYEMKTKSWPVTTTDIISFYPDSVYQVIVSAYITDSLATREAGIWLIDQSQNKILYLNRHQIPHPANLTMGDNENKIVEITDSTLVLSGYEGKDLIFMNYIKIPEVTKIEDNYNPTAELPNNMPKSFYNLYLVNAADSTKQILINNTAVDLTLKNIDFDTSVIEYQHIHLNGNLENITDTSVSFVVWSESINLELKNGATKNTETEYYFTENWEYRDININNIEYVTYTSPAKETLATIGTIISAYSVITTLLVAPLVSIKYREGGFNSERYFIWAGAGLAGLTIGIPLLILTDGKLYPITKYGNTSNEHYWYLKKEY